MRKMSSGLSEAPTRKPTLLIVDDSPMWRELMTAQVRSLGYTTLAAGSATEAVGLLASGVVIVDLVLTDIVMPGTMDGYGLARWVRSVLPEVKIVTTSAYSEDRPEDAGSLEDQPALAKPFRLDDLRTRLATLVPPPEKNG